MPATPDDRVLVYRKDDPAKTKFRWPAHLVAMSENLQVVPSQKRRVTEPAKSPTTTTTKTVTRVTEPEKES